MLKASRDQKLRGNEMGSVLRRDCATWLRMRVSSRLLTPKAPTLESTSVLQRRFFEDFLFTSFPLCLQFSSFFYRKKKFRLKPASLLFEKLSDLFNSNTYFPFASTIRNCEISM